jgi:squalene-hopene cyclase-like protein/prenyltransferase/squalene oxidase-like repeat protein
VGVKLVAVAAAAAALAGSPAARYVEAHQAPGGGFAEAGRAPDPTTTAWATLGLVAAGGSQAVEPARAYLAAAESSRTSQTDLALNVLARAAAGERPDATLDRLAAARPGPLVNAMAWTILALRQAGRPAPPALVHALRTAQRPSGGWSWTRTGAADSNDTAAAVQALRAAGVNGRPIDRAVAYLRARQGRDGGFALTPGRASDAQSTAWAIQALLAAGRKPGTAAYRFLFRMRRADGSYRYSAAYATTPVWVTAQVLPASAGKPFPLRS